jgi:hypothetical protein
MLSKAETDLAQRPPAQDEGTSDQDCSIQESMGRISPRWAFVVKPNTDLERSTAEHMKAFV